MAGEPPVSFRDALRVWIYVGLNSFGGPAGQIAVMHRVLVEEKKWIGERRFLHALNYCMLLPGPEAQQLAIYVGWLLHRTLGGLAAGILFVLPGFLAMLALSAIYAAYGRVPLVEAVFSGVKPAVLAIVVEAVIRIGRRALVSRTHVALAAAAFLAIFVLGVPFPVIIAGAALAGFAGGRIFPGASTSRGAQAAAEGEPEDLLARADLSHTRPSLARALRILALGLGLWFVPLIAIAWKTGGKSVFVQEGLFFSKAAVVTFGGAYAVLSYVAQQAVEVYGWLAPGQMLDGLGLAETTPGPLILVTQFVGFQGAYRQPDALDPMLAGVLGASLTVWVTFVPCFLWIFLGAPWIEALRGNRALSSALSAITAAVVGVILNLAVWFALHALFARVAEVHAAGMRLSIPEWGSVRLASLAIAIAAMIAMLRFRIGMMTTLFACAVAGALLGAPSS
jgi:chromate transporter